MPPTPMSACNSYTTECSSGHDRGVMQVPIPTAASHAGPASRPSFEGGWAQEVSTSRRSGHHTGRRWRGTRIDRSTGQRARGVVQRFDLFPAFRRHGGRGHFLFEPGFCQAPVAHHSVGRDIQDRGRFFHSQAAEESHFDHAALALVELRERFERVVQRHELLSGLARDDESFVEGHTAREPAAFRRPVRPRVIDENPPHDAGGQREEMRAVAQLRCFASASFR